jgi:transposase
MSLPIKLVVKESKTELQQLKRKAGTYLAPRIKMLLCIQAGIDKNSELAAKTGSGLRSIIRWKQQYQSEGIDCLLKSKQGCGRKPVLGAKEQQQLETKLSDPKNGFRSYLEIQQWIENSLDIKIEYQALYKFLRRRYGTKLKVGRKSHIKKDEEAVAFFKKTCLKI